ncbi:MAG: hypothetical protein WAM82_30560 [Thermoanaerobaculia bacterium]
MQSLRTRMGNFLAACGRIVRALLRRPPRRPPPPDKIYPLF